MSKPANIIYLSVIVTICVSLHISGTNQCYGDNNTPMQYLHKKYRSPLGDITVKHFSDEKEWTINSEVWLYSTKNPAKKSLLYSYERDADVLFSHDEKWLVLNNGYGSDGTEAILFKKVNGLEYKPLKLLTEMAWDLFRKTHKQYQIPQFGHSYAEAVLWSSDSKSVMIQIYGHDDDSLKALEPWYCIYDLTTGKMTLDFNVLNRDTYHPNRKANGRELYLY